MRFYSMMVYSILLAGCVAATVELPDHSRELALARGDIAALRRQSATAATLIRRPRQPAWLDQAVQADYQNIPATDALRAALGNHPIRYTFKPSSLPMVSSPPAAATLREHLEAITTQANWAYQLDAHTVVISDTMQRAFELLAAPGVFKGKLLLRALGEGTEARTEDLNETRIDLDPQSDVEAAMASLLQLGSEQQNTTMSWLPASSTLLVQAPPDVMREAAAAVERVNRAASRRVSLELVLYEVDVTSTRERGVDLNAVVELAGGAATLTASGLQLLPPDSIARSQGVAVSVDEENSRFPGSSAVLRWLNQQGETSVIARSNLSSANNQMVSVESVRTQDYVGDVSVEISSIGGSAREVTKVETKTAETGQSLHVVPTVHGDRVHLRIALNQADLVRLEQYSFDDDRIQGSLPVIEHRNQALNISLRSGESHLVANLARRELRTAETRTPWLPWLADAKRKASREFETVLLITATIMERS